MLKIVVPTINGGFSSHFGGADRFAVFEVDESSRTIASQVDLAPPPHEHGSFPLWLREQGANVILAGGMGPRAVQMLEQFGIQTVIGVGGGEPEQLVRDFLDGTLAATGEGCGGGGLHDCAGHGDGR